MFTFRPKVHELLNFEYFYYRKFDKIAYRSECLICGNATIIFSFFHFFIFSPWISNEYPPNGYCEKKRKNNFKEGCYAPSIRERHLMPISSHTIPPILKEKV